MAECALIQRLSVVADLSADDQSRVRDLCRDVRKVARRRDIVSEGRRPEHVHLIVDGWAAGYKVLADGSRQIIAFLIPGDFCDLHITVIDEMDHGIIALSPCEVAYIEPDAINRLTSDNNRIARALWWATLVDESVLRAWIVNIGRRNAYQRVAHLLCEIHARTKMVGLADNDQLALPLTQEELADATGLTAVHMNRTLQRLRSENIIHLGDGMLTILNAAALRKAGGFDPSYLHVRRGAGSHDRST